MEEERDSKRNESHVEKVLVNDIEADANGLTGNQDEVDVFGSTFFKELKKKPGAVMPVAKNALFYNMDHKNRGIAVVLNHEHFMSNMKLKPRAGTAVDSENLKTALRRLGFEVQSYDDLTVEGVDKVIERVSQEDHSDSDCIVIACLSHGEQGILYAKDAPYKPEVLWTRFTADKCPTLAGKPKLFFIQACQGDRLDGGVTLFKPTQVDSSPSYKIPTHADFLIAYSTIPVNVDCVTDEEQFNEDSIQDDDISDVEGFYSWRNTSRGSWFMQALCEELTEHGFTLDILTLLTFVNRKVAVDYESNVPDNSVMHGQKQIPSITYMLTRVLKFSPKEISNEVE